MNKKYLLSSVTAGIALLYANHGTAQCLTKQDCAALGYTETSCSNGGIKCPFGNTWSCTPLCGTAYKYTCSGTGYAGGTGSACGGKYTACKCASGYEWYNGSCTKECKVGWLYYSDGTCANIKVSGKTLLGVVIYPKTAKQNGWIMTVRPVAQSVAWDLKSSFNEYRTTNVVDRDVYASCTNTQKLVAFGSDYVAAIKANNYKPTGTPSGKKWCLPSIGLLSNIKDNLTAINNGINTADGRAIGSIASNGESIWSSTESKTSYASLFYVYSNGSSGTGYSTKNNEDSDKSVRPVMEFQGQRIKVKKHLECGEREGIIT